MIIKMILPRLYLKHLRKILTFILVLQFSGNLINIFDVCKMKLSIFSWTLNIVNDSQNNANTKFSYVNLDIKFNI